MKSYVERIKIDTDRPMQFIDITDEVRHALTNSGIRDGLVTVFSSHTTASVRITERCERLQHDMEEFLKRSVPEAAYRHDEHTVDDRPNARMHLMALFMNASETVPLSRGEMYLGKWQSIFFVELDGPRKGREVLVKVIGE